MIRYLVLAASLVIQICLGGIYAWSTFAGPLSQFHGMSTAQGQAIFGIKIGMFTLAMIIGGRLQQIFGPRIIAAAGGLLFGCGYLIAGNSSGDFHTVLVAAGICTGIGIGLGYVCPIATCIKWFPEHKGLIAGLAVAGFGAGGMLLSQVIERMLRSGIEVLPAFRTIGIIWGSAIMIAAMFMVLPESERKKLVKARTIAVGPALAQARFWALFAGMLAGTFAGLSIIGNLRPLGLSLGHTEHVAGLAIGFFSIGNAAGRITWGWLVDRFGRQAVPASLLMLGVVSALLPLAGQQQYVYLALTVLTGFAFGGCFVIYLARLVSNWGPYAVGSLYPIVFVANGVSGLAGPPIFGHLFDSTGSYTLPIMIAASFCVAAMFIHHRLSQEPAAAAAEGVATEAR